MLSQTWAGRRAFPQTSWSCKQPSSIRMYRSDSGAQTNKNSSWTAACLRVPMQKQLASGFTASACHDKMSGVALAYQAHYIACRVLSSISSSRFLIARHTTRLMAWTLRVRGTNGQAVISGLAADSNCLELQEKIHDKLGIAPARQELLAGFPPRIIQVCSQTATSCGCFYLMLTSSLYVSCNLFITSTREQIKWTPQLSVGRVHISSDSMHEHGTWHTHCNHPGSSLYADICKWTAIRCWYSERGQLDSAGEGLA